MFPDIRPINGLIVVACALLLAIALYMEYVMGLIPCPLCMTQRVFVLLVGGFALLAVVHHPRRWGGRVYAGLGLLAALIGGGVCSRELWLLGSPPERAPARGPDEYDIWAVWPCLQPLN